MNDRLVWVRAEHHREAIVGDFAAGDGVRFTLQYLLTRSAVMPGKVLRGEVTGWFASCGHIVSWSEIADVTKDGVVGKYEPFSAPIATPTYSPEMREKNTNVVLVTEKLPEVRLG